MLKIKQSELRLYCDLLTQQTHDMKNLILSLKSSKNDSNTESVHLIPKNNSNNDANNVSPACSFKSFNEDLNQTEQNNNNNNNNSEEVETVDSSTTNDDNIKVHIIL